MANKVLEEHHRIGNELICEYLIEIIDGEKLDTRVKINGSFYVAGGERIEFKEKLQALIEQYRI